MSFETTAVPARTRHSKYDMNTFSLSDTIPRLDSIDQALSQNRGALARSVNQGEFWKPCPGTTGDYLCCGYQILTPLTGCGMYCRYCVLQAYFDHQCQVVFENYDYLEREVRSKLETTSGIVRFGTGEFADSLFLEPKLGLSRKIAKLLEPYKNVVVEFKTKSANVGLLAQISDPSKVIIGFSLNTPRMIDLMEKGTASLEQRLEAARRCEEMGFHTAFHFDPIIWYPDWKREYRALVRKIFSVIRKPERIAWWSMGGFRCMPELKKLLKQKNEHLPLFTGEMITGTDKKLRYFRPVRTGFYRVLQKEIMDHFSETPLYLCMESPVVWKEAEMAWRIPEGLTAYLDMRAVSILNSR